jgi:hypothetical protein
MQTRTALPQHAAPRSSISHSEISAEASHFDILKFCIEACNRAASACDDCASACFTKEDPETYRHCIGLAVDCAALCRLTTSMLERHSELLAEICRACAQVCDACGDECARHDSLVCQTCAEACYRCAARCRRLANAARFAPMASGAVAYAS